jgi:hypothetical protein
MPLPAIQQLLGHADIATTTIYMRVSADDLARMMGTSEALKQKTVPHLSTLRLQDCYLNAEPCRDGRGEAGGGDELASQAYRYISGCLTTFNP